MSDEIFLQSEKQVCIKVKAHNSSELTLNALRTRHLLNQGWPFIQTILGVTVRFCSFRLVFEGKAGKEIPESSRLEFLRKISANNFVLSDAENNASGSLNTGSTADFVGKHFVGNTVVNHEKSYESSFWEVIPASNYMFKVNNRNTRTKCEMCTNLTIKTPERLHWRRSVVFVIFVHVSQLVLVFLLLTLSR